MGSYAENYAMSTLLYPTVTVEFMTHAQTDPLVVTSQVKFL